MSAWRRKAVELFPERRADIEHAPSIYQLWFELLVDLQHAYRAVPLDRDRMERIYAYATWCFAPKQNQELRGAVAVSFYEHLADFGPARRDLPYRLTREQFTELVPAFRTVLEPKAFDVFQREFLAARAQVEAGVPAI